MDAHPWYHRTMKIFVGCCLAMLTVYLSAYAYVHESFEGNAEFPVDCAVVFGAAVYRGSHAGPAIVRRVAAAADLYRNNNVNRLILSGGRGEGNAQSEAFVMRREALKQGVDMRDIVIEEQSRSTKENLRYTRNLTSDCSSVVAISDQYHLGRIRLLAWRQGWFGLQIYPAQNREPVTGTERWSFQREVFGVLYYGMFLDYLWPLDADEALEDQEQTDTSGL
jgi:uncharacterized SAM-binding protein YcdF (DUF218 family)